jgi:hypothetical protein
MRPDRNPLRRRSDRIEAAIAAGFLVTFLVGVPLAAITAGQWQRSAGDRAELAARSRDHPAQAVLLRSAPQPVFTIRASSALTDEPARWTTADGVVRTGEVPVPGGDKAGATLLVWTDGQGRLTSPPPLPSQISDQVMLATVFTPAALALALLVCWVLVRHVLHHRRLAWWEARWSAIGPRWTSRR